jgi:hypothetical protein
MGGHVLLRYFLYAIKKNIDNSAYLDNLADKWTNEKMGWYVSGGDFSLVKSCDYRGTREEEEIFANYTRIQNV